MAAEHQLEGNGFVALLRGEGGDAQSEVFEVGLELAAARSRLRTLDGHFQETFARLTRERHEVWLTSGHEERRGSGEEIEPERLGRFTEELRRVNVYARELGVAEGLAQEVPSDLPMVVVAGPREPFAAEEAEALLVYVRRGGRLLIMVDEEARPISGLLEPLGVRLLDGRVCSETQFFPRTRTKADRARVYTTRLTPHPAVAMAQRHAGRSPVVMRDAVALAPIDAAIEDVSVVFPMLSDDQAWRDLDGDFEYDEEETREALRLVAAVTVRNPHGPEGRVVIVGEGSFASDELFVRRSGNYRLVGDALTWLLNGRMAERDIVVGQTVSAEDRPIEHTKEGESLWFYATSFGVPLPILMVGLVLARQRRRRRGPGPAEDSDDSEADGSRDDSAPGSATNSNVAHGEEE